MLFVNHSLIRQFCAQVPSRNSQGSSLRFKSSERQVKWIENSLRKKNKLRSYRPYRWESQFTDTKLYVIEKCRATRVIFPRKFSESVDGLQNLAVWVSDPSPPRPVKHEHDFGGTFLYLIEAHWAPAAGYFHSGCSALQAVVNLANGVQLNTPSQGYEYEPFGRGSATHPLLKLRDLGTTESAPKWISTFYVSRYMSDGEQRVSLNGEDRRTNDLLAYPFWITEDW
jgi:hypothetical protein